MPSPSVVFSAYASMTASIMLARSMANDLIPQPLHSYLLNIIHFRNFGYGAKAEEYGNRGFKRGLQSKEH